MSQNNGEQRLRYGIRKLSIGVCAAVIGAFILGASPVVQADEVAQEAPISVETVVTTASPVTGDETVSSDQGLADVSNVTTSDVKTQEVSSVAENTAVANPTKNDTAAEQATVAEKTNSDSVNDYLYGLDYDKTNILTRQGETVENVPATSTQEKNGEFVVVEKTKKTLSTGTSDVSVNGNDAIYVGALLKADQSLLENQPTLISVPRQKATISIDLPGLVGKQSSLSVKPTASQVQDAVNTLVANWQSNHAGSQATPARMQYEMTSAYSMNQVKAKLGLDFEKIGAPLKIDFEAVNKGEKQIEIVDFKQIYYTVTMDAPENPADVFDAKVSVTDLKRRGVDAKTPPVYVSSVSYGRQMYVTFETTSKSTEFKAAIGALIKGVTIAPGTEWAHALKDVKVKAVILGGNAQGAARVVTGDIETLKELIREGASFSAQSPAVAISYKTAFLKDNATATFKNHTDYIETKATAYKNGFLKLEHKGAYIARYTITWDEVSYDKDGKEVITHRQWEDNGKGRTAGFKTELQFKGNVRNLSVKIEERTGLAWEPWRTVYNRVDLPLVQNRTITHRGTTLNPKVKEEIVNA
ncbi:thiol-activated cytolysin family protein [Streptococcus sp. DD12]|uniref:thiol-activated cytolysin family protein n=1 Tax=Streptococcus sp. DD12 TaxID=1777880 RepID=UPI00079616E4|nr:thiol-activated cytolysin family protein [Streptococcus sp. DD12]KXT76679.1 Thiol-activated cytolysin [Streptococcus sp. DD12]